MTLLYQFALFLHIIGGFWVFAAITVRTRGPLPDELRGMLRSPILLTSLRIRLAIVFGIVFLMSVKPSAVASLVVIVVAIALGLLAGQLPAQRGSHEIRAEVG